MLADRIRAEMAVIHAQIDRSPMAAALVSGQIDRDAYGLLLGAMYDLHTAFEEALEEAHELPVMYQDPAYRRADDIQRDLIALGFSEIEPTPEAVMDMIEQIREWPAQSPWKLLGALYVFEGSRMGSMVMAKSLARAFGLAPAPGVGLDYHLAGAATRPQTWMGFRASINALQLNEADADEVLAGAVEMMTAMNDVYQNAPTRLVAC
jgi:heme oxygenase (biliverdin-producing, ferredoxin)